MEKNDVNSLAPFTYIWTVEKYPQLDYDGKVLSPKFTVFSMDRTEWRIELNILDYIDLFECGLWRMDDREPQRIEIDFEFSILAADGTALIQKLNSWAFKKGTCARVTEFRIIRYFAARRTEFLPKNSLTFRCRIWRKAAKITQIDFYYARTQLETEYKSFIWIVKKFSTLQPYKEVSRTLGFTFNGNVLNLELSLFLADINNEKHLLLKILNTNATSEIHLSWEISLVGADWKTGTSEKRNVHMGGQNSQEIIVKIFSISELKSYASHFFPLDALFLKCEFEIGIGDVQNNIDYLTSSVVNKSHPETDFFEKNSNLTNSFEQRDDESSLHANLGVDNRARPAHRNIPDAQPQILKRLLVDDMKDKLDKDIIRLLIQHIYNGTIPDVNWKRALDLLKAANKYRLSDLRKACCTFLQQNLSLSNFCDVVKLVYLHCEDDFQRAVERFFLNHDIRIFNTAPWKILKQDNSREALEFLERLYLRKLKVFEVFL